MSNLRRLNDAIFPLIHNIKTIIFKYQYHKKKVIDFYVMIL